MKSEKSTLLQVLGVGFGVAILLGNSVGIGILRMPGTIAAYLNSEGLIILLWILGGMLSLAGAVIYGEASAAFPVSGGPYAISEKVFGKQAGFTIGFCDWVLNTAGNAALAIATAEYFIPLTGMALSKGLLASLLIFVLSLIQWFGMRSSSIIQQALSLLKALGLLFLVAAFFLHGPLTGGYCPTPLPLPSHVSIFGAIILSFRAITYTYMGWNAPIYFAEEHNDPKQSLPRALILGVLSITVIYVLVNISLFYLMPISLIANSPLAVADGANLVFGKSGKLIVTIISIIIVISGLYPSVLYTPRIIFGMARTRLFFPFASKLNGYYIPGLSLIVSSLVAILFAATGTFEFAVAVTAFLYIFVDASVYVAALYARLKNNAEFSYKAPGYPINHVFMILVNVALLAGVFAEDRVSSIYALVVIAFTVPLFFIFKRTISAE